MSDLLWQPSPTRVENANVTHFRNWVNEKHSLKLDSFHALYDWSVTRKEDFWPAIIDYAGLKAESWGDTVLVDGDKMPGAKFFPDARLNFAENLLVRDDHTDALVFWGEDKVKTRISWCDLNIAVSKFSQALRAEGITKGDRVCGYMPNMIETVIAMLGTAAIGATWSSASPDFGVQGVVDRFGQIEPKLMITVDGYHYNGKSHDIREKVRDVIDRIPSIQKVVIVKYAFDGTNTTGIRGGISRDDFLAPFRAEKIAFEQVEFNHPLYVMFSSGTTGKPKCIVHGAGGTLLKQVSEHVLHCDVVPGDRVFYFTTCGWMMWNWLMGGLAAGATLLLYDGSPFYPSGNILFDYADAEGMTLFGTSAKYIDALAKAELKPRETHNLSTVRAMTSTGSPLAPESFDYVYSDIKPDIHLASISGGTDILGCFVLACPVLPVKRGIIQTRALGLAVDVFDDDGKSIRNEKGELVCTAPFPSMPIGFWNDPDGSRYKDAYFNRFDNIWCHGDYVELDDDGGMVIYGRSDATLNPGGVRIGTAEIYRQVEKLPEIQESIVIGQEWDNDVRVVLFVVLREKYQLDELLIDRIRKQIRNNCTPRHVPAKIIAVADIPRTKSGKITELAVRDVVHGRPVKNQEALANPTALELFSNLQELRS
ncbi:acetoacetate--CoA ligase [Thalassospira xiamenensis]|uniref:Acetoacetyl-CoA synthetase n=11 Tax=Thalassospira TaxID=168934 RepID=A0A367X404_9PROT|nr:acetoacetate--CoA ligase [Thalassospira xiamenensis]KZB53923.1 acetoacetyl-CoA synthetase [Thalassospira xiamenensis]MCK2165537.1 acetoacetate--CoA ligase [Thalassospira xiamenensis]RCK48406.1 acetoacetyl-CoA synthetase [Thalassospira xiamenensis]